MILLIWSVLSPFILHLHSCVVYIFAGICLYVCLLYDNFQNPGPMRFIFGTRIIFITEILSYTSGQGQGDAV